VLGIYGRKMVETWYQMESLLLSKRLNLEPVITHHLPLADFETGFKLMQKGEAIKVVLEVPAAVDLSSLPADVATVTSSPEQRFACTPQ
jgi:hypothetical protein